MAMILPTAIRPAVGFELKTSQEVDTLDLDTGFTCSLSKDAKFGQCPKPAISPTLLGTLYVFLKTFHTLQTCQGD